MVQPAEQNSLQILISAHDKKFQYLKEKIGNGNIETNISVAVTEASQEMKRISTGKYNKEEDLNLFQEECLQLITLRNIMM